MQDPVYAVYYDTPNGRPRKTFGRDHRAAMEWAQSHTDRDPVVVKEQEVWSARGDQAAASEAAAEVERIACAADVEADNLASAEAARAENEAPGGIYHGTQWARR